tara:strand:- start:5252 stop:5590 length:339 start_codon:yes stop_codon:yes gene_type:complete
MKIFFTIIITLFSGYYYSQEFEAEEFLDGTWCQKDKEECFDLIFQNGLLMFEIPEGGYISGVEILKHDRENKKIFWRIIGTNKEQQYFEILKNDKVNHFDGVKTKILYRFKE